MSSSSSAPAGRKGGDASSPRSARAQMEEAMSKLGITEEEATPLVIDDDVPDAAPKWLIAEKVLFRNLFHIQTISNALRPAWGNPRGLIFRPLGENMFVAEFETQRDRDRVWEGSPWHISKHVVILEKFEDHMQPSELKFDKLSVWARVVNLPYNLRNDTWGLEIAKQIDNEASLVQIDPVGGYLRARVTIDVKKSLRRWILIDSAKRKSRDWYDIEYEQIPHFCFSCGRLGHSDLYCATPGARDENGDLPFKLNLRAPDDRKKASSNEYPASKDKPDSQYSHNESRSSNAQQKQGHEVNSPVKRNNQNKRKGGHQQQVYRRVDQAPPAKPDEVNGNNLALTIVPAKTIGEVQEDVTYGDGLERDAKKKKPTPSTSENSAASAEQRCPDK